MLKIIVAIRRRPGLTHAEFLNYFEIVHGGIARGGDDGNLLRYVQTHISDASFGKTGDHSHQCILPRDAITELFYENFAGMQANMGSPYVREVVRPDGPHFAEEASTITFLAHEEAAGGEFPADAVKAMWFLKAPEGQQEAFRAGWAEADNAARALAGIRGGLRNVPASAQPQQPGSVASHFASDPAKSFDGVQSLWLTRETAPETMRRYETAMNNSNWLDASKSFWILGTEVPII